MDEWLGYEIHPETPPAGVLLAERLPHIDWEEMYRDLRMKGAQFGIEFGNVTLLANSKLALQAAEYARDQGKFDEFHEALLRSYFTELQDIGNSDVLGTIAGKVGLDAKELQTALQQQRYAAQLHRSAQEAYEFGITAVPVFIIEQHYSIVGAQPLEVFKAKLRQL